MQAMTRYVGPEADAARREARATSGRNESPLKRAEEQLLEGWSTGPKRTGLKETKPRERGSGLWRPSWAAQACGGCVGCCLFRARF